jgi:hypothetical protein
MGAVMVAAGSEWSAGFSPLRRGSLPGFSLTVLRRNGEAV